jgi:hypothetical protein
MSSTALLCIAAMASRKGLHTQTRHTSDVMRRGFRAYGWDISLCKDGKGFGKDHQQLRC